MRAPERWPGPSPDGPGHPFAKSGTGGVGCSALRRLRGPSGPRSGAESPCSWAGLVLPHDPSPSMSSAIEALRNVAFVGHPSSGKTTLVDALAHKIGASSRKGSVADKTSICDTEPEEQDKGHTLQMAVVQAAHDGKNWSLFDTPGYPDFIADVNASVWASDLVVGVHSCSGPVTYNLRKKMEAAKNGGRGRMIVVTHVDGEELRLRRHGRGAAHAHRRGVRAVPGARPERRGLLGGQRGPRGRGQRLAQAPDGPDHGRLRGRGAPDELPRGGDAHRRAAAREHPQRHRPGMPGADPRLQPGERAGRGRGARLPGGVRPAPGLDEPGDRGRRRHPARPRSALRRPGVQRQVRPPRGQDRPGARAVRNPGGLRVGRGPGLPRDAPRSWAACSR